MLFLFPSLLFAEPSTSDDAPSDAPIEDQTPEESSSNETTEENETEILPQNTLEEEQPIPSVETGLNQDQIDKLLILLNEETPLAQRIEIVNEIHTLPNVLNSMQLLALHSPDSLRSAIIKILSHHSTEDITYTIAKQILKNKPSDGIYSDVFSLLTDLNNTKAAQILKDELENTKHTTAKRQEIRKILTTKYSSWFAQQKVSNSTNDFTTRSMFSLGSSILGQNLFSALGYLSQGSEGETIGSWTGVVAGGVGGILYTQNTPMSFGSATHFTHSNIWGSIIGNSLASKFSFNNELTVISRSIGGLSGTAYSLYTISNQRSFRDIIESNIIIGESILFSLSLSRLINSNTETGFFIGSLGGFILAEAITPKWKPNGNTLLLASIYSLEASLLGNLIYENTNVSEEIISVMAHSGLILGCLQDKYTYVDTKMVGMTAFGAYTGNMIGLGIDLLQKTDSGTMTSIGGAFGSVSGGFLSKHTPFLTPSYLLGSSILVASNTIGLGFIISEYNDSETTYGSTVLATGLGNLAMASFQDRLNLDGEKAIFLASTSLWGSYLATTGIAIALDESPSEYLTAKIGLAGFDIGLGTGLYLLKEKSFRPADTINAQLMAIIGGSLGSFGGYLVSANPRGTAIGSLLGVVGGGYLGTKYEIPLPKFKWFDNLFVQAAPQIMPSGDIGAHLQIGGILGGTR